MGRATLSILAQPFQQLQRRRAAEAEARRSPANNQELLAGLDYATLNAEAHSEIESVSELIQVTPLERASWALGLLCLHGAVLAYVLGVDAARRLAWPLAILAPTAWLLATSRGDETVYQLHRCFVDETNRFPTLGMLDAEKERQARLKPKLARVRNAVAGSSTRRAEKPGEPMTWEPTQADRFLLRGPNYLKDKKKQPSAPALYEPFATDLLRSSEPVFDLPSRVKLPDKLEHEKNLPKWLPRLLIQNMYFPGTPPPLIGGIGTESARARRAEDGNPGQKGWQVVCYWRVTHDTASLARDESERSWPPHLKLWKQYASLAGTMPVLNGCLKGVASVENLQDKELGLHRLVKQYNAKPVLMAASALVGERPGVVKIAKADDNDYFEFALDVGTDFAAMSNHALFSMRPAFPKLILDIGWLIEGRSPDELPEGLLACLRINKVDLELATDMDKFLAEKSGPSPDASQFSSSLPSTR